MLSELFSYTKSDPPPDDVDSTQCTLRYLEACNQLFERGLLSHERVHNKDTTLIENVQHGYQFFCDWLDDIVKNCKVSVRLSLYDLRPFLFLYNIKQSQNLMTLTQIRKSFSLGRVSFKGSFYVHDQHDVLITIQVLNDKL